jgi:catechol 2,3-dioxygenase-like lactoylglutathione lyase family enzyme
MGNTMSATFNHTIIASKDRLTSAAFYRDLLEAQEAPSWGFFTNLQLDGGVLLQFAEPPVDIQMQHYAFLVDDAHFDRAYELIRQRGIEHWADPQMKRPGETNTEHNGRGVYFKDPAGHALELLTRPYL